MSVTDLGQCAPEEMVERTDDILVKETRRPDLAWDKTPTQDTDEEAQSIKSTGVGHTSRKESRHGAGE